MLAELQEVKDRVEEYHDSIMRVKKYTEDNEVVDPKENVYFMLMGLVWTATGRNEAMTDEDAVIYLNLEEGVISGLTGVPVANELSHVPLEQYLDYLRDTYFR